MSPDDVLSVLGWPDDIRLSGESDAITVEDTSEIWAFGTDRHLGFPTLGAVYFDSNKRVHTTVGGGGEPPPKDLFDEQQLCSLLRLIDTGPILLGTAYDPRSTIRVVNVLQALGKEKALAALEEYLRVSPRWESGARLGLFLVLRVLFDLPQRTGMPELRLGRPEPRGSWSSARMPRFPIVLLNDVPLLVITGYDTLGSVPAVEEHVRFFRQNGRIRSQALAPSLLPLSLYSVFNTEFPDFYGKESKGASFFNAHVMIMAQLLRLINTVYRKDSDPTQYLLSLGSNLHTSWKRIMEAVTRLHIQWDSRENRYTFADGSALPEPTIAPTHSYHWTIKGITGQAQVFVQRLDKDLVRLDLLWSGPTGSVIPEFRLSARGANGKLLCRISSTGLIVAAKRYSRHLQSSLVRAHERERIQLEVSVADQITHSPFYTP